MRGQVIVFYALMIPILMFAAGVGLDLGWYYLNVSRLQNAADASVIAGAKALANDKTNFNHYKYKNLVDKYPINMPDPDNKDITAGNLAAANYALKNLSSDTTYKDEGNEVYTLKDNYTRGHNTITMTPGLYKDVQNNYYYVIGLSENIHHFFLGFLDDMKAGVVAVAMLKHHVIVPSPGEDIETIVDGTNILSEMYALTSVSVIKNWEWYEQYENKNDDYHAALNRDDIDIYGGNWNEYQAKDDAKNQKNIQYEQGKKYRTETVDVFARSGSEGTTTGNKYNHEEKFIDSLNLDFKADILFSNQWKMKQWKDFDIIPDSSVPFSYANMASNDAKVNLRIHATFNFEKPFSKEKRQQGKGKGKYDPETNPEDVLFVRIESEPIRPLAFKEDHRSYNSVRQIILNINQPNTGANDRPLMFFYTGPETLDKDYDYEDLDDDSHVRASQPVILNLNADARVCLFAPHSPVVINGNNNKMQGFVIAKKFVRLTTEDDYDTRQEDGEKRYFDKSNPNKEYFLKEDTEHGNDLFIDEYGNVDTRDLPLNSSYTRYPDYLAQLKNDSERSDYLQQLKSDQYYLNHLKEDSAYANCSEVPERADKIDFDYFDDYEKIYKLTAFNLNTSSYYDSFQVDSLKRNVYTYLDNYLTHRDNDPDNDKPYSTDMFLTTIRSTWID